MAEGTGAVKSQRDAVSSPPRGEGDRAAVEGLFPPQHATPPKRRRAPRVRHAEPRSPGPERVKDRPCRPAAPAARSVLEALRSG